MDAAITNIGTTQVFIPGPNINLDPGETKTWSDVRVSDLDGNSTIKAGVVAGTMTVSMTPGPSDAAVALQGQVVSDSLPVYAYADLPTGFLGRVAFVTDGRKAGELAGAGTGVPCYYDTAGADWFTFSGNIAVTI